MKQNISIVVLLACLAVCLGFLSIVYTVEAQEPETNYTILNDVRANLNELETLIRKYEEGTVEIWPGYTVPIPAAIKTQIKTRAGVLRTSARAKLLQLSLD